MKTLLTAVMFVTFMAQSVVTDNVKLQPVPVVFEQDYSEEDLYNLVMITIAEADGESELGKRYVIDTVLNRVESNDFPNNITDVIFQENQFSGTGDRWDRCTYSKDTEALVKEELKNRTNTEVLYFRTLKYPKYETPLFKEGNHYFSGIPNSKSIMEEEK